MSGCTDISPPLKKFCVYLRRLAQQFLLQVLGEPCTEN